LDTTANVADQESDGAAPPAPATTPPVALAHPSPPWSRTTKAIIASFSVVLVAIVLYRFRGLIQPLVLAAIIAFLLNPGINWAMRRLRLSRGWAVALVFVVVLLAAGAILGVGGFVVYDQTAQLVDDLPRLVTRVSDWVRDNLGVFTLRLGPYSFDLNLSPSQLDPGTLVRQAFDYFRPAVANGGSLAAQVATATVGVVSTFFVMIMVSIYLAKDSPRIWGAISDVAHAPGYRADADRLIREFVRIWDRYLRGQVLLALAMFAIVSVVLWAMGVRYAFGLGLLSGLLEFLPILGPLIAGVAAVLVALFQDGNNLGLESQVWFAVTVAAVMFALQQLEAAVLVPRFVGDALDLHPVIVIVVVLMGASLAGILGAVLAAPVAATVKLLAGYGWRKMFDQPPFPDPEPPHEPHVPLFQRVRAWWRRRR
jgi:predicted PurR-regulated permease PerM